MRKIGKHLLMSGMFFLFLSFLPVMLSAQPGGDCDFLDPDAPPCPIDGGITLLLAAGIGYGAKKIKENRKLNVIENL